MTTMNDDAELLRRYAASRSEEAFAAVVQRHIGLVYQSALRRCHGDAHCAEDVTQQVFTAVARDAAALAEHPLLAGWLHIATRNFSSKAMRAEAARRQREEAAHFMNEAQNPETPGADWARLRPVLDAAIDELGEREREAVLLRFFENRPFAEIGAALRVTEDAARMRVDRALDKLHAALARRGVTSTAAALSVVLANHIGVAAPAGLAASVTGAAMASTEGAAVTALGLLQFMSTTKFGANAVALLTFLAVGTTGYQLHAQREAERALAADREAYGARVAALRDWEQRVQTEEQTAAQLKKNFDEARATRNLTGAATAKPAADYDPVAAGNEYMRRHPETRQAKEDAVRGENRFLYDPVFRSLGLSDAQVDEILKLQEWHYYGTTKDGKLIIQASEFALPKAERESRIRAILGEEGYAQYAAAKLAIPGI